jgi:cardiolipin synthase
MNTFALLPDMPSFLDAVYDDVRRARERVSVECYIFREDRLGREFADLLVAAAERGVPTRLLYDPFGSQEAGERFFDALRLRGLDVKPYRDRVPRLGPLSLATRNHARNLVIDGAAYAGGIAWADPWLPRERGGGGWYDVAVRATGPVVEDFAAAFEQRWADDLDRRPRDFDTLDRHPDVRLVSDSPARESLVFNLHVDRFHRARERIWLAHSYFFPPARMLDALAAAAARGVDVRVVMPGASDLPIVARAARAAYLDWTAAGLRVFEYQPALMHAKYAVVDGDWATVGSFNANATSLLWAVELNPFVSAPGFVAELARHFEHDLAHSREVRPEEVRARTFVTREIDHFYRAVMALTNTILGPRHKGSTPGPRAHGVPRQQPEGQ